jgi:exosortase A-associated hydrolase 2
MNTPAEAGGLFLQTSHGHIFVLRHPGSSAAPTGACAILVAPFAEEMNKTRRMWTLLAGPLAREGIEVLIPDLYGTGESEGDFADARWQHWLDDLAAAHRYAMARGATRFALVGTRLGALLALDFFRELLRDASAAATVEHIVLWQPVASGEQFINQFLRLKLAAGLRQAGAAQQTTASLRERIAAGERLEVAGYELAGDLVAAIDRLTLASFAQVALAPITWLEVSTSDPPALTPVAARTVETLRRASRMVDARAVRGEAFWALQEITVAPELVAATVEVLAPLAQRHAGSSLATGA